jgi:hypothetical protein
MRNVLEQYRGWSIIQNNDGIICIDPKGSNCLPGACTHSTVSDARKSIDYYILAKGDAHLFWLLWGHAGVEQYAHQSEVHTEDGRSGFALGKRDNPNYKPSYEYLMTVNADRQKGTALAGCNIRDTQGENHLHTMELKPEQMLAYSNVLRDAALYLLGKDA